MTRASRQPGACLRDEALDDLRPRLARTRWSPEIANGDWDYGVNGGYLRDVVEYWRDQFDWRKQEAEINRFRPLPGGARRRRLS